MSVNHLKRSRDQKLTRRSSRRRRICHGLTRRHLDHRRHRCDNYRRRRNITHRRRNTTPRNRHPTDRKAQRRRPRQDQPRSNSPGLSDLPRNSRKQITLRLEEIESHTQHRPIAKTLALAKSPHDRLLGQHVRALVWPWCGGIARIVDFNGIDVVGGDHGTDPGVAAGVGVEVAVVAQAGLARR